ncbi:peptidoglycan-binding domain-containing protein [Ferrovibrio xuzhouensis]|uniref:Peptidoglycan-binding protein n=1 Tax=Ferrovibrio xuzhouensis TaxID=1576914 RepID=A0ABV7VG47_9PROT
MPTPLDESDIDRLFRSPPVPEPDQDPFGRIGEGDPAWDRARAVWLDGASLDDLFGGSQFDLNGSVGANQPNQRGDVFKMQGLLHREGHLDAEATGGPTGYWGGRDDAALRGFQKENGLAVDGWAAPDGETMTWLRDAYRRSQQNYPFGAQPLATPTPDAQALDAQAPDLQAPVRQAPVRQAQAAPSPPLKMTADSESRAPGDDDSRAVLRNNTRQLAVTLGLDPAKIDLDNPQTLRALGAARFYHYLDREQQYKAMQDIERLGKSDPRLAGRLRGKIADSIFSPVWEIPMMTPERLEQAIRETETSKTAAKVMDGLIDVGTTLLPVPKTAALIPRAGVAAGKRGAGLLEGGYDRMLGQLKAEQRRRAGGP